MATTYKLADYNFKRSPMFILLLGLLLFLGVHSVRIIADEWRERTISRIGIGLWKGLYSLVSLGGFVLIVWGFWLARQTTLVLWVSPLGMRHTAALLTLIAFVLLAAVYVPRNSIKSWLHHPMLISVVVWAFAHLLANGTLADVLLFGSFLLWAIFDFYAARLRDQRMSTVYASGTIAGTLITILVGTIGWALFAFWLHRVLFGMAPLGVGF